ncbi:MAG: hypothetical protein MZV65_48870 [Chromatiales bacterium]|nr:hypothetical protein [Chromatiales bacterium]
MMDGDKVIQFRCRKGIDCWNKCCSNIDISLTPYDILRLKKRLGITSTEFLALVHRSLRDGEGRHRRRQAEAGGGRQRLPVHARRGLQRLRGPPHRLPLLSGRAAVDAQAGRIHRHATPMRWCKEPHCLGHNEPRSHHHRRLPQGAGARRVRRAWRAAGASWC